MHGGPVSLRSRIQACDTRLHATGAFQGRVQMGTHLAGGPSGRHHLSHRRYSTGLLRSAESVHAHPGPSKAVLSAIVQNRVVGARVLRVTRTGYWRAGGCGNIRRIGI